MATNKQKQAATVLITALAKGATVAQAAYQAGVSERTVYRRLKNPEFQARIEAVQEETLQRVSAMLTAAVHKGLRSLIDLQKPSTPPSVRRGAARDIIVYGMRYREDASVEKRIAALENRTAANGTPSVQAGVTIPSGKHCLRGDSIVQAALACGDSVTQAARKAGLSERTVYRRLKKPSFQQCIETLRADMVQRAAATLIAAMLLAIKTLTDLQDPNIPASVRRSASRDAIELGQKVREFTVLEKRLIALENALESQQTLSDT
jgi:AcrR family transcriptional regulator